MAAQWMRRIAPIYEGLWEQMYWRVKQRGWRRRNWARNGRGLGRGQRAKGSWEEGEVRMILHKGKVVWNRRKAAIALYVPVFGGNTGLINRLLRPAGRLMCMNGQDHIYIVFQALLRVSFTAADNSSRGRRGMPGSRASIIPGEAAMCFLRYLLCESLQTHAPGLVSPDLLLIY